MHELAWTIVLVDHQYFINTLSILINLVTCPMMCTIMAGKSRDKSELFMELLLDLINQLVRQYPSRTKRVYTSKI